MDTGQLIRDIGDLVREWEEARKQYLDADGEVPEDLLPEYDEHRSDFAHDLLERCICEEWA